MDGIVSTRNSGMFFIVFDVYGYVTLSADFCLLTWITVGILFFTPVIMLFVLRIKIN